MQKRAETVVGQERQWLRKPFATSLTRKVPAVETRRVIYLSLSLLPARAAGTSS